MARRNQIAKQAMLKKELQAYNEYYIDSDIPVSVTPFTSPAIV